MKEQHNTKIIENSFAKDNRKLVAKNIKKLKGLKKCGGHIS